MTVSVPCCKVFLFEVMVHGSGAFSAFLHGAMEAHAPGASYVRCLGAW